MPCITTKLNCIASHRSYNSKQLLLWLSCWLYETVSATSRVHDIKSVLCALRAAEAEKQYGQSSLKIYTSSFVPLYHAVTQRKTKTHMKMICLLPTEKVRFLVFNTLDVMDFQ